MSSIIDYAHIVYYVGGLPVTLGDFFCSDKWKAYLQKKVPEAPLQEGINLLIRLANEKKFVVNVMLFGAIVCGDVDCDENGGDAYRAWKTFDRAVELKRFKILKSFLQRRRSYPYILYPLFNQKYNSMQKAQQLYDTMHIWNHQYIRRQFFMLVFKYGKRLGAQIVVVPNLNVTADDTRKKEDVLLSVYKEAGNAFWDFVEYLDGKVEVIDSRRGKKREGGILNAWDMENEWIEWMTGMPQFLDLLNYHRIIANNKREHSRFTVLVDFLLLYLKGINLIEDIHLSRNGQPREQYLKIRKVHE